MVIRCGAICTPASSGVETVDKANKNFIRRRVRNVHSGVFVLTFKSMDTNIDEINFGQQEYYRVKIY